MTASSSPAQGGLREDPLRVCRKSEVKVPRIPQTTTPIAQLVGCLLAFSALALGCSDDSPRVPRYPGDVDLPREYRPRGREFMVVVLPDTQIYAEFHPETFESQLRWIAEHADEYRIVFVTHVGDIVESANQEAEWDVARAAYEYLDDLDIPHGLTLGGHDFTPDSNGFSHEYDSSCSASTSVDCDAVGFMTRFGPERYEGRAWYSGASPTGRSSYQTVEVEGLKLLFLHLLQDPPPVEVEWANAVLDANPDALAHVTTHRYMYDYRLTRTLPFPLYALPGGRFPSLLYDGIYYTDGLQADQIFEEVIAIHPNVWAVHCGHVDAEFRQTSQNEAGLPVYENLVDFQDMADGGGGWLRLLRFKPDEDQVEAITFSTLTGMVRGNGAGFEHSLGILEAYKSAAAEELVDFGVTEEDLDAVLARLMSEDDPLREHYRSTLYDSGQRDSHYVMDVDFAAYVAPR